jgi:hypothetical protein
MSGGGCKYKDNQRCKHGVQIHLYTTKNALSFANKQKKGVKSPTFTEGEVESEEYEGTRQSGILGDMLYVSTDINTKL